MIRVELVTYRRQVTRSLGLAFRVDGHFCRGRGRRRQRLLLLVDGVHVALHVLPFQHQQGLILKKKERVEIEIKAMNEGSKSVKFTFSLIF